MIALQSKQRWIRFLASAAIPVLLLSSCASTGPKVTKEDVRNQETQFYSKYFQAADKWHPRIFRVGYQLITSPVPGFGDEEAKFNFAGVAVDSLKSPIRDFFQVPPSVKGVYVLGTYPGSEAEFLDFKTGDIITRIDGKKTKSIGSFYKRIRKTKKEIVTAEVWRRGELLKIDIPIEKVYYKAQFFLSPTPDFEAHASLTKINVGIGAIRYARNDDELAVIMGHELAHTTLKHSHKKLSIGLSTNMAYYAMAELISAFTFPGVGGLLVSPVQNATDSALSRRYEREADYFGMQHAFHAGYEVESGSKIFARLATDTPNFALLSYTFATHPKTSERFLRLQLINDEFKRNFPMEFPRQKSPDWNITIPVREGETLQEALDNLVKYDPEFHQNLIDESENTNPTIDQAFQAIPIESTVAETVDGKSEKILSEGLSSPLEKTSGSFN